MSEVDQGRLLRDVRLALQAEDFPTAISNLQQVIVLAQQRGDNEAKGRHLGNLALIYYRQGDRGQALASFEQALECARQEKDRLTEEGLLGNMGNILREMGRFEEAHRVLSEALIIAEELEDTRGRGIWLGNLGLVYDDVRQPQRASQFHAAAVDIARELQDRTNLISRLVNMGNSCIAHGDYATALPAFKEVVELTESTGRPQETALRLGILGNLSSALGKQALPDASAFPYFQEALTYYQRTLELTHQLQDYNSEAEVLRSIAAVFIAVNQRDEAARYLEAAHNIFAAIGMADKAQETARLKQSLSQS
jgi:tetratricopeptide (TPR) repeat protein